jgi:hypothetical protein
MDIQHPCAQAKNGQLLPIGITQPLLGFVNAGNLLRRTIKNLIKRIIPKTS